MAPIVTNNWSQDTYIKAYKFAAKAHHGQKVPGTEIPYIQHLSFVSMEIIAALNVEKERDGNLAVQCAILHDTIEDTNITFEQIKSERPFFTLPGAIAIFSSPLALLQQSATIDAKFDYCQLGYFAMLLIQVHV